MAAHRSNRPLGWLLFGTGGFLVAFFLPVHVLLYGLLIPLGFVPDPGYQATLELLHAPLTRIYLFFLLALAFFHAGYRIRDTLCDMLGVRQLDVVLAALCYGGAIAGTTATFVLLVTVP
jgi:succinate dehydrogenase subunit D